MNGQNPAMLHAERSWLRFDPAGEGSAGGAGAGNAGGNGALGGGSGGGTGGGSGSSAAGSALQIPAGHRLVKEDDWNTREQSHGLAQKYGKYGTPEELEAFAPLLAAAKAGQVDPRMLSAMLKAQGGKGQGGNNDDAGGKQLSQEEMMEQLRREAREERMIEEWQNGVKGFGKIREEQLKALLGENPTAEESELYGYAVDGLLAQHRGTLKWPDGHPLNGRFMPALDGENSKPAWQKMAELRKKLQGKTLSDIGDAANKQRGRGTPAGNAGTQGKAPEGGRKETAIERANRELEAQFA